MGVEWLQQRVSLKDIKPYERNPRRISKEAYAKLKDSLEQDGYHGRMLCTTDLRLLGGHQRLKVLKELGHKEVDVLIPSRELSEEECRRLLIRDNLQAGEWDFDLLSANYEINELLEWGFPEDLLPKQEGVVNEPEGDEDAAPDAPAIPQTVRGDVYEIGPHRLMCGDSTLVDDVDKLMAGAKADMVFTDPPYGVSYTGGLGDNGDGLKSNGREMIKNDDIDLYEEAVKISALFCKGPIFMFYADTVPFGLYRGIENIGGEVVALLIWKKAGGYGAMGASYKPNHEPCLIWKPKGAKLNFIGATNENRVWEENKDGKNKLHPTQKPVSIPTRAIGNHKADIVLDLFGGSGSTMVAAHKLGRTAYLMELDEKYCDVIVQRMVNLFPELPIKRNGEPFVIDVALDGKTS
jgi:DNA modification methylase